jgi:GAF domain-containing protein/HAMP domain-containing protein/anti-sigma regulatory factor (Ser/Thr protein kinase)
MEWKKTMEAIVYRGGLRRRLLLVGLTLLGTALVINTLAGSYYTRRLIVKKTAELQKEIAARVAHEIGEFVESKITRLVDYSSSASFHGLESEEQRVLALLLLKNDKAFTELALLDNKGREVLKVSERRVYLPSELSEQSQSEKFKKAILGQIYIGPVYTSDKAEPYVSLAVPIKLTPQETIGVTSAETNLKTLWDVVGDIQFGQAGYAYLVDRKGNLIAHRDSSLVLKRLNLSFLPEIKQFLQNPRAADPSPARQGPGITGEPVIGTYAPVAKLGWAVVMAEPVSVALSELRKVQSYAFLLLAAGLLAGAFIIVWVSNRITNPIRTLHRGAQLIGAGNLDYRVHIKSGDEIEELAQGFNKMALELKSSYSNLEQKVDQRTQELSALYTITSTVNQSLEVEPVLQEVIKKITEIFRFDATRIFLFNRQRTELHLRASFETQPEFARGVRVFQRREGIVGRTAETGEAVIFEDVHSDPRYQELSQSKAMQKAKLSFMAALPIKAREKCVGSILFFGEYPRKLSEDEMKLLTSMADQIGVAVENARLYQETTVRAKQVSALYDVAATVNQSMDPTVVLREVIRKVLDATQFDAARIYLIDAERGELVLRAHHGLSPALVAKAAVYQVGNGINGRVVQTGEPLIFKDIQIDPDFNRLAKNRLVSEAGFHSYLSFPLKSKTKTLGTMNFLSYQVREISSNDIALLNSMANQIGIAFENISLFEETAKTAQQLSALFTVTAAVSQSLDLHSVLQEVMKKITEIFQFDTMRVYLLNERRDELHMRGSFPSDRDDSSRVSVFRAGQGIVGKVVESGEPIMFEDVRCDPQYRELSSTKNSQNTGFSFFGAFPIKAKHKTVGAVVCNSQMPRRLAGDEVRLLTSMTDQIGVAVENTALFEQAKARAQQIAALHSVAATVSQSLDLEVILNEAIEKVLDVVGLDAAWIYLIDPDKERMVLRAWKGIDDEVSQSMKIRRVGAGIPGKVAETGMPVVFENVDGNPHYSQLSSSKKVLSLGFHSGASFPIKTKKVLGVLNILSRKPHRFSSDELQLLGSIASAIGVAVENAYLFEETKLKTVELERLNRDLQEANNAKSEFMAAMSHELRTPLNVVIGNADLALDGFFGEINDQQRNALQKVLYHSKTLLKLINDVLTFTKMEAGKAALDVSTFHVDEIVNRAQDYVEQLNRNGHVKISWKIEEGLAPMTTDALKLEEILQNLIGNAFKFTPKGLIEIRVRDLKGQDRIEFAVQDTGIGIKPEDLPRIFEQFHQLKEAHTGSFSGVGLGLSIVKRYLELMRGDIQVQSDPGKGSTFIFTLPYSEPSVSN